MFDVALALEYLHHGHSEPVVHCDLKSNNVLLDDEMVAHVGDFGIAKILAENKTLTQTKTLGTLGYIAPGETFQSMENFSSCFCFFSSDYIIIITKLISCKTNYPKV